jgi:hypothetical protein
MSITRIYIPGKLSKNIDGTIHMKGDKELIQSYYREILGNEPELDIEISITRVDSKKTNPQLAYFYGVVLPIIKDKLEELEGTTFTKEEVMYILKDRFFYEEILFEGEFIKSHLSLSTAKKSEVAKFIDKVINFATDILDLNIPTPTN